MIGLFAELTLDPAWPWSLPGLGVPALAATGGILALLTIWTYLGVRGASWRRVLVVLGLRLLALLVACLVVLRPSFADRDQAIVPSKLLVVIDASGSMNLNDEFNGQSRWEAAQHILKAPAVAALLRQLQNEQKVEVVYYQAAEDVAKFEPGGKAYGKRTDMGQWLRALLKTHGGEQNLRGLVLLTDGADNGTRFPTLQEAARWRGVPCPIYTFALGSPTTTAKHRDIAVTAIHPDPAVVPVKNRLLVKAMINAPGLEDQTVRVHLLINDREVAVSDVRLPKTQDNEVLVGEFRPEQVGEIKVTVKVDKVQDEISEANNEMSTYVTVTNDGVSVLWVEGKRRAWEPRFAIEALAQDKRFSVTYTLRAQDDGNQAAAKDWFNFTKKHYDVIVIGDISAEQFAGGRANEVFGQIEKMVKEKGTGLLMLGGQQTFANGRGDWKNTPLANLLPVWLEPAGQVNHKVRVLPTDEGLRYTLRLSETKPREFWVDSDIFRPLDGMAQFGKPRDGAVVFAKGVQDGTDEKDAPAIMVAQAVGAGRTMVFGGDTTWKAWRRDPKALKPYERFWRQVVLWLAHREDASGNTFVIPDTRRVAAGSNNAVGFTVGVRGKGGLMVPNAKFEVKVIGPHKEETIVQTATEAGQQRGYFYRTNEPGEYTIHVKASGKDADGSELDDRPATARFLCYAEDLENLRPAADHEFLKKLAAAGGGAARVGGEDRMTEFLEGLLAQPLLPSRVRAEVWPDWRVTPVSDTAGDQVAALWTSGLLLAFVLFVVLVSLEWFLRRRWGMV